MAKLIPKELLFASAHKKVDDLIDHNLKVLFCGINPGLYSSYSGHHFAKPGNRFWKALYASGFTERILHPSEEKELLKSRIGITNIVERASLGAAELSLEEYRNGANHLEKKLKIYKPEWIAFLGIDAYRKAFLKKKATFGFQQEKIAETKVWVLPNPSGLNAHFTPQKLAEVFVEFRKYIS